MMVVRIVKRPISPSVKPLFRFATLRLRENVVFFKVHIGAMPQLICAVLPYPFCEKVSYLATKTLKIIFLYYILPEGRVSIALPVP